MTSSSETTMTSYCDHREWKRWYIYESVGRSFVESPPYEQEIYGRAWARIGAKTACPYCSNQLSIHTPPVSGLNHGSPFETSHCCAGQCRHCGWWRLDKTVNVKGMANRENHNTLYEGIIRRFDLTTMQPPVAELRRYLERHISKARFLNPVKFEHLVAAIYRDFYSSEVRHVGGPGDSGIDAIAVICDVPHLIQVKRRKNLGHIESVATVREFVGALLCSGKKKGHIVTTAEGFSLAAEKLIENQHLHEYRIELTLITLHDLLRMLKIANKQIAEVWRSLCG